MALFYLPLSLAFVLNKILAAFENNESILTCSELSLCGMFATSSGGDLKKKPSETFPTF